MTQQFCFPDFYNYPPYFTLQPVKDTRQRQTASWCDLILQYARECKVFIVKTDAADEIELFVNKSINRRLNREARVVFLSELVQRGIDVDLRNSYRPGNAMWLDKDQQQCLLLWRRVDEWADLIAAWARDCGIENTVMTIDELSNGDEIEGTDLDGVPREVVIEALKVLEARGRARMFKGATPQEEGVKFF